MGMIARELRVRMRVVVDVMDMLTQVITHENDRHHGFMDGFGFLGDVFPLGGVRNVHALIAGRNGCSSRRRLYGV